MYNFLYTGLYVGYNIHEIDGKNYMSNLEDKYLTNFPSDEIVTGTISISECGGKCLIYDGKEWVDIVNFLKKKELNLMFGSA